jgi:hypothetical protein
MRPLGYGAAVRLTNGEIFTGSDHAGALDNAFENGSIRVTDATVQYGFRDRAGNFISMDEADRILEQNWWAQQKAKGPELRDYEQAQAERTGSAPMSEAEPLVSSIANRYTAEKMAMEELGRVDPSEGQSTEKMVMDGMNMSPNQREGLINNFMKGRGGDLDQQGAAIRAQEMLLSEQNRAASRAAASDPSNVQAQAEAKAAFDAVTAFHNGPVKKFKQVWSDSGRVLQKEIPLDYTTLNGMKEAYLKNQKKEVPAELEPKLKQMADVAAKASDAERAALGNLSNAIGNQLKGKMVPTDDQIRTRLMAIMKNLPCPP